MRITNPSGHAHQFDSMEQQRSASTLGMWAFLVTEVMFFSGLFVGYAIYRMKYGAVFAHESQHLDLRIGAINTLVLISSSLTMALAVHAASLNQRKRLIGMLAATLSLGLLFLGFKGVEYAHKYQEHLIPGSSFVSDAGVGSEIFYSFYFSMTGMHALHMIVGIGLLSFLIFWAWRRKFTESYHHPVELSGLYWHFVDIIWIFLFPLLYLVERAK